MPKKEPSFTVRHVRALRYAITEAAAWEGALHPDDREAHRQLIVEAREGVRAALEDREALLSTTKRSK